MSDPIFANISALTSSPATGDPSAATDPAKLRDLASQFEGLLMSQMMKDLKMSLGGEDDGESGSDMGPLSDVVTSQLGLALSRAGGFGLGDYMARALASKMATAPAPDQTGDATETPAFNLDSAPAPIALPPAPAVVAAPTPTSTSNGARVSSPFGWRSDPIDGATKFHKGMDVAVAQGTTVYAPADGKVVSVGQQTGYGLTVVVQHANGLETKYAHLSGADVRPGDAVSAGEPIARSGNTGRSTGAHLHFEVLANGQAVDPSGWVDAVVAGPAAAPKPQATR
jgi:murein DD-endopeptidase MepM/ murein hydrolase activator NlpD